MDSNTTHHVSLTMEDKYLIELLVDGELDELRRKELLVQLDRIEGGWRFCAVSFLESQCLRETCRPGHTVATAAPLRNDPDRNTSRKISGLYAGQVASPVTVGTAAIGSELISNRLTSPQSSRHSSSEPTIIPLKKGGYRPGSSFFSSGGSGGGGTRWPALIAAMAGGFLLAVCLTGVMTLLVSTDSAHVVPGSNSSLVSAAPEGTTFPDDAQDQPIRLVTLKSPDNNLNGIRVPCVEANASYPDSLRELRTQKTTDHYVQNLKKNGHKVETIYEELAFPLEDGRTLILPVDTFNVQFQTPQLQNFQ